LNLDGAEPIRDADRGRRIGVDLRGDRVDEPTPAAIEAPGDLEQDVENEAIARR
jgi:hypothetical protein